MFDVFKQFKSCIEKEFTSCEFNGYCSKNGQEVVNHNFHATVKRCRGEEKQNRDENGEESFGREECS